MRRTTASMTALLGLVLIFIARAPADEPKEKPDAEKLIGTWKLVKEAGKPVPPGLSLSVEFLKDEKMKLAVKFEKETKLIDGTWKLDGKKLTTTMKEDGKEKIESVAISKLDEKDLVFKDESGSEVALERVKVEKKDK